MGKMRALVKSRAEPGLWMEDAPIPEPGIYNILIKVHRTSICGTDIHILNWDTWAQKHVRVPVIIGHEFSGRVEALGSKVDAPFKVGDTVSGEGHVVCGQCRNCLAGRRHLCARPRPIGVDRSGAFAEYLVLPATNVWYPDSPPSLDLLSCFDPLGNATHTALSFDLVGEDVLITGAGPIGLMATAIARHVGARFIVVTDINPYRLALARKMGATITLDARTDRIESARERLKVHEGFDVGMEMSGSQDALREMVANMCHGGKIGLLGIQEPGAVIDWDTVIFSSLTIKGIYGREMLETWYKMTAMIQSGLDIRQVITHHFPIEKYREALNVVKSGNCGKVIMEWIP